MNQVGPQKISHLGKLPVGFCHHFWATWFSVDILSWFHKETLQILGGSQSVSVLIACTVLRGDRVSVMISVLDGSFIGSTLFVGSQYIAALIPLKPLLQEALYSWW